MPRALAVLGAVIAAGTLAFAQQPPPTATAAAPTSAEPEKPLVVPVHHEPHHRQVFQYGPMRILDLQIPPNDTSWFHSHEWPVLYMTLSTSQTRTQILGSEWGGRGAGRGAAAGQRPGGPPRGGAAPPGGPGRGAGPGASAGPRATSTTSYAQEPVTHRLENIGTGLFRAMVVVNETQGDDTATEQAAGFDAMPELTNKWFRSYRLTLKPGESTPSHRHRAPVVIFQATAGKGLATGAMKWEFNEPGQWAFFDANSEHQVRNSGDGQLELLEIEVRRK